MDTYIQNDPLNPINTKEKDFVNICDDCGSEKEYNKEKQNDITTIKFIPTEASISFISS